MDRLPDELLDQILRFVILYDGDDDDGDLYGVVCRFVSRRWNDILEDSKYM